jgi:hypothetical protein
MPSPELDQANLMPSVPFGNNFLLPTHHALLSRLERDPIRMNRRRALGRCLSMIFPENRFAVFRIVP